MLYMGGGVNLKKIRSEFDEHRFHDLKVEVELPGFLLSGIYVVSIIRLRVFYDFTGSLITH